MIEVRTGHNLELLQAMPSESVQCCLTSPPYWGLRDYGDPGKEWPEVSFSPMPGLPEMTIPASCEPLGLGVWYVRFVLSICPCNINCLP